MHVESFMIQCTEKKYFFPDFDINSGLFFFFFPHFKPFIVISSEVPVGFEGRVKNAVLGLCATWLSRGGL